MQLHQLDPRYPGKRRAAGQIWACGCDAERGTGDHGVAACDAWRDAVMHGVTLRGSLTGVLCLVLATR